MNEKVSIGREWKIIIIILSVALLGTLGYIFVDSFRVTEPIANTDDNTTEKVTTQTPVADTEVTTPPETVVDGEQSSTASINVFPITQWDIQGDYVVNHPADYEIVAGGEVLFTSSDLTGSCADFTVASVFRRTGDQLISSIGHGFVGQSGNETVSDFYVSHTVGVNGDIKHIGEYYYIFVEPETSCFQTGVSTPDAIATRVATDIYNYFITFRAI